MWIVLYRIASIRWCRDLAKRLLISSKAHDWLDAWLIYTTTLSSNALTIIANRTKIWAGFVGFT